MVLFFPFLVTTYYTRNLGTIIICIYYLGSLPVFPPFCLTTVDTPCI